MILKVIMKGLQKILAKSKVKGFCMEYSHIVSLRIFRKEQVQEKEIRQRKRGSYFPQN